MEDCMLDIVVGIKSNLTRNSIVSVSSSIEIETSKIVAKYSKCVADRTGGNLIEQASRSASILPADRAAHSIGAPGRSAATFLFWKPINRVVLVFISTFGKFWPASSYSSPFLRFLSIPVSFHSNSCTFLIITWFYTFLSFKTWILTVKSPRSKCSWVMSSWCSWRTSNLGLTQPWIAWI